MNIRERIEQGRNWLTEFGLQIPGYGAYLEREGRRDADAVLRDQLATVLERSRDRVNDARAALADSGKLALMGQVERVDKELWRVASRMRHAPRGCSGFFDPVKIDAQALDRVYEHDAAMLEGVRAVSDALNALAAAGDDVQELSRAATAAIDQIEQQLDQRDQVLRGLDTAT